MTTADRKEFLQYLRQCTTSQVEGVIARESHGTSAYHRECADLARQELRSREHGR